MLIRHIGHAEFAIETESGFRIVTDPYDESCGYPVRQEAADAVLVSHQHHDHNAVENVAGMPQVIDRAGSFTLASDVRITAVKAFHDDRQGEKRGENLLFLLETEGLRVVHLGDLGHLLTEQQISVLRRPDVLLLPVGGFFTIDAKQARLVAEQLEARILVPMHYKTEYTATWPISGPDDFLNLFDGEEIQRGGEALRVTEGDVKCHKHIILL